MPKTVYYIHLIRQLEYVISNLFLFLYLEHNKS